MIGLSAAFTNPWLLTVLGLVRAMTLQTRPGWALKGSWRVTVLFLVSPALLVAPAFIQGRSSGQPEALTLGWLAGVALAISTLGVVFALLRDGTKHGSLDKAVLNAELIVFLLSMAAFVLAFLQ